MFKWFLQFSHKFTWVPGNAGWLKLVPASATCPACTLCTGAAGWVLLVVREELDADPVSQLAGWQPVFTEFPDWVKADLQAGFAHRNLEFLERTFLPPIPGAHCILQQGS